MRPRNGKTGASTKRPPDDWPGLGQLVDDGAVDAALGDVERKLEAWLEAWQAHTQTLARGREREANLQERETALQRREEQLGAQLAELDLDSDEPPTDQTRTGPRGEASPRKPAPDSPETVAVGTVAGPATPDDLDDLAASVLEPAAVAREPGAVPKESPALSAEPSAPAVSPAGEVASVDLDPETARKLRVLRRLAPGKSDVELLAQLGARKHEGKPRQQSKRRWWRRERQ